MKVFLMSLHSVYTNNNYDVCKLRVKVPFSLWNVLLSSAIVAVTAQHLIKCVISLLIGLNFFRDHKTTPTCQTLINKQHP